MIVRCRFCGEKIRKGSENCEHCGKNLISPSESNKSSVDRDTWEEKAIPAWVMYLAILFGIGCVTVMFIQGCDPPDDKDARETAPNATKLESICDAFTQITITELSRTFDERV